MEDDVWGVRISPPFLEFLDVKAGESYKATVCVKNTSKTSKRIQIKGAVSKNFKLTVVNPDKPIAPGLQVFATVEYMPKNDENFRDRLILLVDEVVMEIPLLAFSSSCYLDIESEVDFGKVVANSTVLSKEIGIVNHGSAPGAFKIKYQGNLPITIVPTSGIVEPKTMQLIKVELCTNRSRTINEVAIVKLQDSVDATLNIKAEVVEQVIELLDTSNQKLECVHFGPAYFGTSKVEQGILYNNSPVTINWVAVLQDDAVGAEVGTDLEMTTDAALLEMELRNRVQDDISGLVSCLPSEGTLGPYEKAAVSLCFSPLFNSDVGEPAKKDYTLFMKFEIVGSKDSFIQDQNNKNLLTKDKKQNCVELALTGTGLPVNLTINPGPRFSFKECSMGERVDILCMLQNNSLLLPVVFGFRKTANFNMSPSKGKINPGQQQDVMLSFAPHQVGSFKVNQLIDVFGQEAVQDSCSVQLKTRPFHQISLYFTGVCKAITKNIEPKFNPGITPSISNETGQFVEVKTDNLRKYSSSARMAVLSAAKTGIHTHKRSRSLDKNTLVAFPNDRYASIRPALRNEQYRTIFTKAERYNYVDPDFAYTEEEEKQIKAHKDYYFQFIQTLRKQRIQKEKERHLSDVKDKVDIGIKPAAGLHPQRLSISDIEVEQNEKQPLQRKSQLLTTRALAEIETRSTTRPVTDGLNVVPSTPEEKEDCNITLTAQQLHQVIIGPSTVNFGEVCVHSVSMRHLNIVNNLPVHIWMQIDIDCQELQQTSPLSHVVPPMSRAFVALLFETNTLGKFQKSITYSINKKHCGHVLVLGTVVPVALELCTQELVLTPTFSSLTESGFRSTVALRNPRNHSAEFTWKPIITERGIAFSIRPATGTVEAHKELECEVVWHPSFYAPEEGEFDLCVHQGNTARLKCTAKLGPTHAQFAEQHIVFGAVALNFTTVKTAILRNTGQNHAYFQVCDVYPLPGMTVIPAEGVVPVGGYTELQILFSPNVAMKFDTRVEVAIRNTKTLELRIGGSVEVPQVEMSVKCFKFYGVYTGSTQAISFTLQNKGAVQARVEFDLSEYKDFSLRFQKHSAINLDHEDPHIYSVDMDRREVLECFLLFTPTEVAAYDFSLPVRINNTRAPSPPPSSIPKTPSVSEKHIVTPRPQIVTVDTPSRRVQATALRPPLEISKSKLEFIHSELRNLGVLTENLNTHQTLELKNTSQQEIIWTLDLSKLNKVTEESVFKVYQQSGTLEPGQTFPVSICFCPARPGRYSAEVPLFLNEDHIHPYRHISLSGIAKTPKVTFDPPYVVLTPVPLDTEAGATITIIPQDYIRNSLIHAEIPELELDDGSKSQPFSLQFPSGQTISILPEGQNKPLTCEISFKFSRPVAFSFDIIFTDELNNRFLLPVAATADNCILTAYPYLALHRSDQQIVLKSGQLNGASGKPQSTGEAILHPCYTPGTHSSSTSSSSTFIVTSSTCEESFSDTLEENQSGKGRNKTDENDPQGRKNTLGFPTFPAEDSEEGHFYHGILKAVQKWFSLYGWPKGSHPISVPQSLRSAVCKVQTSTSPNRKTSYQVSHGKDTKTVYDMLFHLSGQMLPGITASQSLPCDLNERVLQLHWQHSTLLTFLKAQGSSLAYIRPEFLLAPEDFRHWIGLQVTDFGAQLGQLQKDEAKGTVKPQDISLAGLDAISFESLSKRAWTDVLLQIYKVLVLSRVSTNDPSNLFVSENVEHIPKINPDPLSSNIYSTSERKLLTWLNFNYEKMRSIVWRDCSTQGDIPPGRWIINFDLDLLDGLVLAAVLAAYCPFLISTHFLNMYTSPTSLEQCLHNSLVLVNAFRAIGLDIDIQATDISDPNAVMLLMLCVYLYERLPQYLPRKTVDFFGSLHAVTVRQVRLKNSSSKPLVYNATIVGRESADFSLPKGNIVTVLPKGQTNVTVEFASRFLHPLEAVLLLTSRATCGAIGATMAFSLRSQINHITPSGTIKCKSPCYELKKFNLKITNPFNKDGEFRINLVESKNNLTKNAKQDSTKNQDIKSSHLKSVSDLSSRDHIHEDRANSQDLDSAAKVNILNEFFSPVESVVLEAGGSEALEFHYLPFHLGKRYCTIILSNEQIGEFVYSVEGKAELPLPLPLFPVQSLHVLHVSSASPGHSNDKPILCFKCSNRCVLEEELKIPLVNEAMERALVTVAQQRMSSLEFERRKITGTLESSSVRAAVSTLGMSRKEVQPLQTKLQNKPPYCEYTVEVTMPEHFQMPKTISLPVSVTSRVNLKTAWQANVTENDAVAVPLKFHPPAPGRYPCQIILHSPRDVRVYLIECVVNSEGTEVELEFVTPAHQSVTQEIPLNNQTLQDWKLRGIVKGSGFYGPPVIYVRAGERVQYPLMFRPVFECITLGKLTLQNETDGTEHIFGLKGVGKKPLALDHVVIDCQVRQITQKVLMVPNYTQTRLICKVVSDLPLVSGAPTLDIKAGHTASYPINISSWKRGKHTGVISFVAEDGEQQQTQCDSSGEETDDKQPLRRLSDKASHTLDSKPICKAYTVWFSLEINSLPETSLQTLTVQCAVQDTVGVEIPITNPINESLQLDVLLMGPGLIGEGSLVLRPKEKRSYLTKFSPAVIGRNTGCVIFQSDVVGEFWYELELIAEKPVATTLPELQCELGKWTREFIPLVNSTDETLELETVNSNPSDFSLEIEPKKPLVVAPHSSTKIPVQFRPSALGKANHTATITFKCRQLAEWTFHMSGVGLIPRPMEPLSISTCVGTHSSIIVPFRNPTDDNVLVDVLLTDQEQTMHRLSTSVLRQSISKESAFRLPLKQTQGILLTPKEKLDIPLVFTPDTMRLYESLVVVRIVKEDGGSWAYDGPEPDSKPRSISRAGNDGSIKEIRWVYPIHGIPESVLSKSSPAVIRCQARNRIEERIEVLLTGSVPGSSASPVVTARPESLINKQQHRIQTEVHVTEGLATTEEFLYDVQFESDEDKAQLESSVALCLLSKERDIHTGIVTLIFNIIFAPYKPLRCSAFLAVRCATGGIWKFPIRLVSTEPEVDDVINIEAVGLNKVAMVGFRLTSQTRYVEPFTAYFLPDSGSEFEVSPQSGELLPIHSAGTLITVSFSPSMYSKKHRATLVIQTGDMQWMYDINGVLPQYIPPTTQSSRIVSSGVVRATAVQQRNFIRENLQLASTSVSSPIKGCPLVLRTK
ncbi:cilia- and flagella-associated protein 47-like isoform X2 [Polyodon spathula]|uniref:cilia- and flagella-associated protein 47-like isoform X2 n=1 Tax=Polyodon spathula TaxID=7913 RepID=UPI001B7F730B|nr:cilia- and flagella-associated protein 47-like isoform X2 [Polyodon spathula]